MSLRRLKKDIEKIREKSSKYEEILVDLVGKIIDTINSCDDRDIRTVLVAGTIEAIVENTRIDGYIKVGVLEHVKNNIIYKYKKLSDMVETIDDNRPHVAF